MRRNRLRVRPTACVEERRFATPPRSTPGIIRRINCHNTEADSVRSLRRQRAFAAVANLAKSTADECVYAQFSAQL